MKRGRAKQVPQTVLRCSVVPDIRCDASGHNSVLIWFQSHVIKAVWTLGVVGSSSERCFFWYVTATIMGTVTREMVLVHRNYGTRQVFQHLIVLVVRVSPPGAVTSGHPHHR